jgi:raffinose/stachyose/melibiose transport system permease protein
MTLSLRRELSKRRARTRAAAVGGSALRTKLLTDLGLAVLSLTVLFPFYLVLVTALKSDNRISQNPLGLPDTWHWGVFRQAWQEGHFGSYFMNSVYVAVPVVLAVLAGSLMTAYAFATMRFRGRGLLFAVLIAGLTIPLEIIVTPLYYEMLHLGLLDTLWALILPQIAMNLPFGVLLLRAFIGDLPRDLLDAGRMDGCGQFRLLTRVVLPLCRPALLSLLVFTFMWTWNQFLLPLIMVQSDSARTLPIGLSYFQGRYSSELPLMMAGVTITFLPIMVVYLFFQRQIIRGITTGAGK